MGTDAGRPRSNVPCRIAPVPDDVQTRLEAFAFLTRRTAMAPDGLVTWAELSDFRLSNGERCPLIGASGIWKPRQLELPISVATAPPKPGKVRPYDDLAGPDGTIQYRYRGTDPHHRDNVGLRTLAMHGTPIAYFYGIEPGRYRAMSPTYVIHDDPDRCVAILQVDADVAASAPAGVAEPASEALRRYVTAVAIRRVHQARFRSIIMHAYRSRCSVCSLQKPQLLDAAHIVEDADPDGIAAVTNGLSLCKIHHAAYDQNLLGIDPGHEIHIAARLLDEVDGPMLQHGLKDMHGRTLAAIPSRKAERPDPERLERRFTEFRRACS